MNGFHELQTSLGYAPSAKAHTGTNQELEKRQKKTINTDSIKIERDISNSDDRIIKEWIVVVESG